MMAFLKLMIHENCCDLIIIILGGLFILQVFFWLFIVNNPLLGKNTSPNFSYNFSLFENVYRNNSYNLKNVRIVSDNKTFYINKLQKFLINVENITLVEIYNNSKYLYDLLKKSYDNFTDLTIQLDIREKNKTEEINFLFKIWELEKRKIKKSSNEFYITLNYKDKNESLEKIKNFTKYQQIVSNFITYIKRNSQINNPKVIVESSQFINVPNEKLYETNNKNKKWIIFFSFYIILLILGNYEDIFKERKNNLINLLYGIKSYQNFISLFISYSYMSLFYGIFEFFIFEKIYFDLSYSSIILCFIAIIFFFIQSFFFNLFFYNLFRKINVSDYLLFFMLLINIIFIISNGFYFFTSYFDFFLIMIPNIWFIMIFLNIMKINYFQSFSWDLLKMNDFEEYSYIDYIKYSIIFTSFYIFLITIIYVLRYCFNCFKKNYSIEDNNFINEKENDKKYHQELNQEEKDYKLQNKYLSIKGLTKKYDDIIAINNLTFDFFPNEIFCLIGFNGAGKTTLIKMISGLEEPNEGNILFQNISFINNDQFIYQNVGICDQNNILSNELTTQEYIEFLLKIKGKNENKETISNLLEELELKDRKISRLSYEEKNKLSIIIGFLGNNKIILLDEPTSGISRETRDLICNFLKKNKKDKIIIFTTHSLEEASFIADKIGIIKDGKIICSGTTSFIKEIYSNSFNLNLNFDSKLNEESKNELIKGINENCKQKSKEKIYSDILLQLNISDADFEYFFEYLDNEAKEQFNIINYSISSTTLEDILIFLNEEEYQDKGNKCNNENGNIQIETESINEIFINKKELSDNLYLNIKKNIKSLCNLNSIIYQLICIFVIPFLCFEAKKNLIDNEDFINIEELIKTSEINIYTNDIDYINNSYYFKNTPNKIKFNNITNFENISDFAYFIKNNSKLMNERSAILFKKENEIIKIYNLYQGSAPDYFQATMNMLINIISEKEFGLYINSGKEYGDLDIFIYFNDRNLYTYFFVIEIIIIFIANLSHIPFKEKHNNIIYLLYLNGNSKLNYWIGIFISDIFRIIIYIIIIFIFFYIQEFMFSFLIDITLCLFASCMFIYFISLFYSQIHIFLFFIYFHLFIVIIMILSYFMIFVYSLNINQSFIQRIESLKNWNYKFTISDMCPITSLITLFIRLLINNNSMNNKK